MRDILLVMQIKQAAEKLLHHALELWHTEPDLLVRHASQVVVQIVEQQVKAAAQVVLRSCYQRKKPKVIFIRWGNTYAWRG